MVGAVEFGLPADGNYRWKQTLDLRQAGVGEASERFKKKTVIMGMNAKGNGCNFEVFTSKCLKCFLAL